MKAVKRFKTAIQSSRPLGMESILGKGAQLVQPPLPFSRPAKPVLEHKTRSEDNFDRKPFEQALTIEGVHRDVNLDDSDPGAQERQDKGAPQLSQTPSESRSDHRSAEHTPEKAKRDLHAKPEDHKSHHTKTGSVSMDHDGKGHARDPLSEHLYLGLGPGETSRPPSPPAVSESPLAADSNIYETAYHQEIQRLKSMPGRSTTLFLTRRVSHKEEYRQDDDLIRGRSHDEAKQQSGLAKLFEKARTTQINNTKSEDSHAGEEKAEHHEGDAASIGLANAAGLVRNMAAKKE